jgi:hypothetical protein
MSDPLYRLVYYSRNVIRGPQADIASEIDGILATSQRNNARVGVTGALIFNAGIFAQVLEGSQRAIEETFERIQRDPRHGEVMVLAFERAASRGFPTWSMGFLGRSVEGQDLFGRIGDASGFEPKRLQGEKIFDILRDMAVEEESRAVA